MAGLQFPAIDNASVVHLETPLRVPVGAELRDKVEDLLRRGERRIVLDLAGVSDLDAAGVGELLRAYNRTFAANGILRIVHSSRRVRELLARVGVFEFLHEDMEI